MPLMLGCQWPPKTDTRTIKLSSVMPLKQLYVPSEFDAEVNLTGQPFPARMWGNDYEGCCVIAAQANLTRVLEYIEQGKFINITDEDVHAEYRKQSGGADGGLYMLDAFNDWHKDGWEITGGPLNKAKKRGCWAKFFPDPKQHLDIHAFAKLDSIDELRAAVYYLQGCQIAVRLTDKDMAQFRAGEPWSLKGNDSNYTGGHCVNVPAFRNGMLECWTWKRRQLIEPDWFEARQYDIYAVVDNRNNFLDNSPVDCEKLEALLLEIKNS
jgi:hypothetical protein